LCLEANPASFPLPKKVRGIGEIISSQACLGKNERPYLKIAKANSGLSGRAAV
jgi:hypothetical protein